MAKRKIMGLSWPWTGCLRAILALGMVMSGFRGRAEPVASRVEAQVHAVALEYQETSSAVITWPAIIHPQAGAFAKEPPSASGKTIRGVLNIGGFFNNKENASNSLAFVWQRDAGKLYLECVPGQTFASDSASVVLVSVSPASRYQTFTNLHLPIQSDQGRCQILTDLSLYDYGDVPGAVLTLHSLWQSKLAIGGKEWQIGIIPTAPPISFTNGFLVLRPWEQRQASISTRDGCLAAFAIPQEIFFDGVNYRLGWQSITTDAEVKPVLQLVETPVELSILKLTGQHLGRLLLESGKRKVLVEQPENRIPIPIGSYGRAQALLVKSGVQATLAQNEISKGKDVVVTRGIEATLNAGGPLTNSVTITRVGQDLRLAYHLFGADGREYQLANLNRGKPPKFTVYKDGHAIAAGDFEFG